MLRFSLLRNFAFVAVAFCCLAGQVGPVFGQWQNGVQIGPDVSKPSAGPRSDSEGNFIDFDNVEAPCGFNQTVALTDEYAAQGVVFGGPFPNDGGAILDECGDFDVTGHSPPNFLAFNVGASLADGGTPQGPEHLFFDPPTTQVTINAGVGFAMQGTASLACFNSDGNPVGFDMITVQSELQPLSVSFPVITFCLLSFTTDFMVFDDLRLGPPPVPAVSYRGVLALVVLLVTISTTVLLWRRRSLA